MGGERERHIENGREWGEERGHSKTKGWALTISLCFDFITFFFSPPARETALLASLANELHCASLQVAEI